MSAVAALIALAAFSAIPLALWVWRGLPLPGTWEPARWLTLARRGYLHPDVLPNTLAVLIWIAWAQVALALLREIAARLRRGATATRTVFLSGAAQHLAGSWIASLAILLSLTAGRTTAVAVSFDVYLPPTVASATQPMPADAVIAGLSVDSTRTATHTADGTVIDEAAVPEIDPDTATWRQHTVRAGENLWSIVEDEYPDLNPAAIPEAVDEVFETNRGLTDSRGRTLRDPQVINPGMELRLPAFGAKQRAGRGDGTGSPGRSPQPAPPATPAPTAPLPGPGPATSSEPSATMPPTTERPNQGIPGALAPSFTPTPLLTPAPFQSPPSVIPPESPAAKAPSAGVPDNVPGRFPERRSAFPPVSWIGGAGLLATAIVGLLAARRRRRDNIITPRRSLPVPQPALAELHTALLEVEEPELLDRLDVALRSIGAAHRDQPEGPSPQVLLVHPDRSIEVFLHPDGTHTLPPPWQPAPDQRIWTLPATAALDLDPEIPPPCPALVQLGTTLTGAAVFADLEALGTLGVAASPTEVDRLASLARAIVTAIVVSPWAGLTLVRTIGLRPPTFAGEERVHAAGDIAELAGKAQADAAFLDAALRRQEHPSTLHARIAEPGEEFDPTIVILAAPPDTESSRASVADLADAAGNGRRGLAVVLPAQPGISTTWTLRPDANPISEPAAGADLGDRVWRLDPLGIALIPAGLTDTEQTALAALVAEADAPPLDLPPPDLPVEISEPFVPPPWEVMVRLLGPVDVISCDGRTPPPDETRERTNEVLAWLVTHRHGTRIDLESALWPRGATPKTLSNGLSRARRLLINLAGQHAQDWLPRFDRGTLTLDARVVSDLEILRALLRHAVEQRHHRETAIAALQEALDLIRGVPAGYPWLDAQMGSILTTTPVNAAILLAEHQLAAGDTIGVLSTTARGLELLPAHTALFALRMRAHAAAGDTDAVKAEYRSYLRAEKAEPLWDGDTDRELEALHQRLAHRGPAALG
ncbi:SARP family transcriptional regulator [Parafrankia sp. EUN1f]|uniref:SARP family transcriptional regulator n=1 Tax=Parafrankia sp. EUN1f TaxID=102897 RepID=UPI0012FCBBF6|nr:SARP family transcriptional regulator [Parafrankia sp. EUN1f]